jgi:hypothetical protein
MAKDWSGAHGHLARSLFVTAVAVAAPATEAHAKPTAVAMIEESRSYPVDELSIEGLEPTEPVTVDELLPRPLPTTMTGTEILELARRIKNLALFDRVEVEPVGRTLHIRLDHKASISPIFDLSTGKTLRDSKTTVGAVHNDIDGHATRLGVKASYSERGLNFSLWLFQHPYRPRRWTGEYEVYYQGSGFRFEGEDTEWHRNRFGGEVELLSPFAYGQHFRYEFQINAYRETLSVREGLVPPDGTYVGTASEFIYDRYTWNDLTPSGFRSVLELRPGVFVGPDQARHEVRAKTIAAAKLAESTALVAFTSASAVNLGNPNHAALLGSVLGVRGLPDSLYRNHIQAFANVELRQALPLGKRWFLQGVAFTDVAGFLPMNARGEAASWLFGWSTGMGLRVLPTALVDTLLRLDAARLHYPFGGWLVQFGINQYI